MKVKIFWAWYDLWIGFYWNRLERVLYFCPLPTIVIAFTSLKCIHCKKAFWSWEDYGNIETEWCGECVPPWRKVP